MKSRGRNIAQYCAISVALVFGLNACIGDGGGETATPALVFSALYYPSSSLTPSATIPGAAAAAVLKLKQNGITVQNYWCTFVVLSGPSEFNASDETAILVVASTSVADAAKINHQQNPDPLSGFYVYEQKLFSLGDRFDCESNGW